MGLKPPQEQKLTRGDRVLGTRQRIPGKLRDRSAPEQSCGARARHLRLSQGERKKERDRKNRKHVYFMMLLPSSAGALNHYSLFGAMLSASSLLLAWPFWKRRKKKSIEFDGSHERLRLKPERPKKLTSPGETLRCELDEQELRRRMRPRRLVLPLPVARKKEKKKTAIERLHLSLPLAGANCTRYSERRATDHWWAGWQRCWRRAPRAWPCFAWHEPPQSSGPPLLLARPEEKKRERKKESVQVNKGGRQSRCRTSIAPRTSVRRLCAWLPRSACRTESAEPFPWPPSGWPLQRASPSSRSSPAPVSGGRPLSCRTLPLWLAGCLWSVSALFPPASMPAAM